MIYEFNLGAVLVFGAIVALTLIISFYFGKQAKSASGFFAAAGGIPWFVNGVAFAGDYLSAASFLGICGMIAFYGYDGFLYSIGYLAGWVVALFVIAEPLKRLGRFTFADALDSRFQSRGIKLAAAISTLAVSIFYLIPQMVGAGVLVTPLFGLPHWVGVVMVGAVVILIVVTAGMVSTTYVQFLKGSLLVVFSAVLVLLILDRGLNIPAETTKDPIPTITGGELNYDSSQFELVSLEGAWKDKPYIRLKNQATGLVHTYKKVETDEETQFLETQTVTVTAKGKTLVNGLPHGIDPAKGEAELQFVGTVEDLPGEAQSTGPLGPLEFFRVFGKSEVALWPKETLIDDKGATTSIYVRTPTSGQDILRPGNHPSFQGIRKEGFLDKLNFLSLMLALFCGTASLPHILIRYYTVSNQAAARKSTIVGIGSIGFFYILTLYMGLGAMTSGGLDVTNSNMAAPLLAQTFSPWLFAAISAIAFTTVLGTVSGLIIASSGAVVHDLMVSVFRMELNDYNKVRVARIASVVVGAIAILLGILFEKMNVNYLVGWAFSVAASANLPALVMLLFWKRTTKQGITAAIFVGMTSSLAWILLSGDTYKNVYGLDEKTAIVPFSQPGIVTIPLGFLTLVLVSLLTSPPQDTQPSTN